MRKVNYVVKDGKKSWDGIIKIQEITKHLVVATVDSRDTEFQISMSCYYDGPIGMEWCMCVPNYNFGCKLSKYEQGWNEEQFKKYIANKVDRRSLSAAIMRIFEILEEE